MMNAGNIRSQASVYKDGFWLIESTLSGSLVTSKGAFAWGRDVINLIFRRSSQDSFFALLVTASPKALTSTNMGVQLTKLASRLNTAELKMFTAIVCAPDQISLGRTVLQTRLGSAHPANAFDDRQAALGWLSESIKQYRDYLKG